MRRESAVRAGLRYSDLNPLTPNAFGFLQLDAVKACVELLMCLALYAESVPARSKQPHHLQFLLRLPHERETLITFVFVDVPYKSGESRFAEVLTRLKLWRYPVHSRYFGARIRTLFFFGSSAAVYLPTTRGRIRRRNQILKGHTIVDSSTVKHNTFFRAVNLLSVSSSRK